MPAKIKYKKKYGYHSEKGKANPNHGYEFPWFEKFEKLYPAAPLFDRETSHVNRFRDEDLPNIYDSME